MIILLNGTSSSGKTSIAKELQEILKTPYFYFGVDQFLSESLPPSINFEIQSDFEKVLKALSGFNRSLECLAETIDDFIIDHVIDKDSWLVEVADSLSKHDVFFVGVTAPLAVINDREASRTNRKRGTAKAQFSFINGIEYDLTVDTSSLSPQDASKVIVSNLRKGTALKQYESMSSKV